MTRHRSHILLTDGLTFMLSLLLPVPVHHTTPRQVVWRQLYAHPVPWEDPDVVHPHLPRDVGEHLVPVLELHPEHGVREGLHDRPLNLDDIVFGQAPDASTSGNPSLGARRTRLGKGEPSVYGQVSCAVHATGVRPASRPP